MRIRWYVVVIGAGYGALLSTLMPWYFACWIGGCFALLTGDLIPQRGRHHGSR